MKTLFRRTAAVAVVAALGLMPVSAADNQIIINGTVGTVSVVGFQDVSAETTDGLFVGATLDLGTAAPGADFTTLTKDIYVLTNNSAGVAITLTDAAASNGDLQGPGANIPVVYSLMGAAYTLGVQKTLTTTPKDGTTTVGTFVANPDPAAADQTPGTYTVTLNVAVTAL